MHRQSERFYASIIKAFCNSRGSEPRKPTVEERDGNRRDEEGKKKKRRENERQRTKVERVERFRVSLCVKFTIPVLCPWRDRSLGPGRASHPSTRTTSKCSPETFSPLSYLAITASPFHFDIS